MAEKTSTELIPMLKNAYSALKDKEKDLVLAAELGKSLLEHNLRLKSSYDSLLHSTPPITPSTSTSSQFIQTAVAVAEDDDDDEAAAADSMRFIPSRVAREAMIEVLEKKNSELSMKLETAVSEQERLIKTNSKSTRKLENEIGLLKSNLDIATTKIQELEDMNSRQRKQEEKRKRVQVTTDTKDVVEELYDEIGKMEQEKEAIEQSKLELEAKLVVTLKDLGELKNQFEQFEFTQRGVEELQEAYERQYAHIEELKASLEEHRTILQKLRERGVNIHSTPAPSLHPDEKVDQRPTLLGELETEWRKNSSVKELTERSFATICHTPSLIGLESVLSRATGMDQQMIDDAILFINQIEAEHFQGKALYNDDNDDNDMIIADDYPTSNIYPTLTKPEQIQHIVNEPKTFIGRLRNHIRYLFHHVWKWCRFSIVITTALLISAWQGPDSLLIT
ncbi:hypothetical protein G6F56_008270 [Rhizopus delemar]|nr:hypothetical protein G6F56_008270 [Rhizopus delemar]